MVPFSVKFKGCSPYMGKRGENFIFHGIWPYRVSTEEIQFLLRQIGLVFLALDEI